MTIWTIAGWVGLGLLVLAWLGNLRNLLTRGSDPRWKATPERFADARPTRHVTVVVPARNEERNIEGCIRRLQAQDHEHLDFRVVDDRSTDRTPEILERLAAEEPRLSVVQGEGPPPGWMGKVAACWRGQDGAEGELLLFLDADVKLEPEAIRCAVAYMDEQEVDGVTLIGRLVTEGFWERAVQPVVGSLILVGNPPEKVNDPEEQAAAMANGQFILVSRDAYDAVGGHEAIRGEVMDDVAFARLMKSRDKTLHLLMGYGLMSVRMYHGLREIWDGWTKNLFVGLHRSVALTGLVWSAVFTTALLPFLLALGLPFAEIGRGAPPWTSPQWWTSLGICGQIYLVYGIGLRRTGHRVRYLWTYPLGVVVLLGILLNSALRGALKLGVRWKGRSYTELGTGHPEREPSRAAPATEPDAEDEEPRRP